MSNDRPLTIFFSAAEASGDLHGANLLRALKKRLPDARFVGVAGEKMAAEGCEVIEDVTHQAEMLGGPLLKIRYWLRMIKRIKNAIGEIQPDVHVPIDSPALNWHLAKASQQAGAEVFYYIAPQVWAWGPWRIKKMARLTDHVACILPFEERYLRDRGVNANYVGHPLFDELPEPPAVKPDLTEAWAEGAWNVAMMPGSRGGEIRNHTPALLETAREILKKYPKSKCTFTARTEKCAEKIQEGIGPDIPEGVQIAVGRTREVLREAHFALAVSGTVTLEVAHFGVPMVVFYRVSRMVRSLQRVMPWAVKTEFFSLVNILAGRRVVRELIPWNGNVRTIVDASMEVINELGYLVETREELGEIVAPLRVPAPGSASDNAAALIEKIASKRYANRGRTP
ncbi:MAG: lipid-A-disaccharide synthase [Phycisphaerae bacterium]